MKSLPARPGRKNLSLKRFRAAVSTVAIAALLAALAAVAPTAANASEANTGTSTGGFWLVMTPGESFAQAVAAAAQGSPGNIASTLRGMQQRQKSGLEVKIPETVKGAVADVQASSSDLSTALAATGKAVAASSTHPATAAAALAVTPDSAPQASWAVRGEACNDDRSWCELNYVIEGYYCDETCTLKDKITASATVDPSTSGQNRVSWNTLYSPDNGDFSGYHFEWYVLKFASLTECGTGNSDSHSTSTSGAFTASCNQTLYSSRNTTAVEFWGYFTPNDGWINDEARDGTAVCQSESSDNNYCLY